MNTKTKLALALCATVSVHGFLPSLRAVPSRAGHPQAVNLLRMHAQHEEEVRSDRRAMFLGALAVIRADRRKGTHSRL